MTAEALLLERLATVIEAAVREVGMEAPRVWAVVEPQLASVPGFGRGVISGWGLTRALIEARTGEAIEEDGHAEKKEARERGDGDRHG